MGVYRVYGQITFDVDCEIEANSEAEAKELMMTKLMDYYKVDEIPSVNIIYLIDDNGERHGVGYDWFKCFSLAKPFERKLKFT
jgi:hypothetical protein